MLLLSVLSTDLWAKHSWQILHWKGRSPVCDRKWASSVWASANFCWHMWQIAPRYPVCDLTCLLSFNFWSNDLFCRVQPSHEHANAAPLCIKWTCTSSMWSCKSLGSSKHLPHSLLELSSSIHLQYIWLEAGVGTIDDFLKREAAQSSIVSWGSM